MITRNVVDPKYWSRAFHSKRKPDVLSVHRLGPVIDGARLSATSDILDWFKLRRARTGGKFPYHIVVWLGFEGLARVEQTLPFDVRGAAQRGWNYRSIGIAVVGDWRHQVLQPKAAQDLVDVCVALCDDLDLRYLAGHSELANSSHYKGHVCPGKGIDLDCLRRLTGAVKP